MALPPGVAVLGMGDDGHTASWFPRGEGLSDALATGEGRLVAQTHAPDGEARVTLTLGAVLAAGTLVLAGILAAEFSLVQRAFEGLGMKLVASRVEKEWRSGSFQFV